MSSYAALTAVTAASVPNAAAGKLHIFVDIADGAAKSKDSAGTVVSLSSASALSALAAHLADPDAHLNYVTLTEANALVAAHASLTNNPHATTKAQVGLGNADNTSDLNKPVSTATQTALNLKENTITAGTAAQYFRGDKTFQPLNKAAVGLSNVDNTSDANKPVSTAQATAISTAQSTAISTANVYTDNKVAALVASSPAALDTLAELAAALGGDASFATTTATALGNRLRVDTAAQGLSAGQKTNAKTNIDLQNVDNTSDANKPVSTATQTALNLKYNASNPNGYETPAQLNARDTDNRNRTNHTGSQLAATISDFSIATRSTVLTGLNLTSPTPVLDTDAILEAIGKLQAQLNREKNLITTTTFSNSSNVTLVQITELAFSVVAGKDYSFKLVAIFNTSATNTGIGIGMSTPDGAAGSFASVTNLPANSTGTSGLFTGDNNTLGAVVTSASTSSGNSVGRVEGRFRCTTSGTLLPIFRSEVNGNLVQVVAGSFMFVREF